MAPTATQAQQAPLTALQMHILLWQRELVRREAAAHYRLSAGR